MSGPTRWLELQSLLEQRLAVIADHDWRDRDPAGHLDRLRQLSEAIAAEHQRAQEEMPPRLNHFLTQASYGKALDWLRSGGGGNF